MSNSRRAALLAAACSLGLMAGFVSAAQADTLTDAIALAYQTNPTLQKQRASQRYSDEGVVQAKTSFRPTVSVSTDVSGSRTDLSGSSSPIDASSSQAVLSISQPLYTGGKASANLTAAENDVLAARENLRTTEQSVLLSVIQAYVDVRRDEERLRISQENVAVLTRQLEESKARFDVGEITRTDVAQSEARLASAHATLTSAEAQLAISRASYAAAVGQNPTDLAPEPSLAALLPATVEQAFDAAENNNPGVVAARFNESAAAARVAANRASRRPTVSASASLGYYGSESAGVGNAFKDYDQEIKGSVTASIPLFKGGLTSSQVRAAIENENSAHMAVEVAKRSALQSVSNAWANLLASRSNIVSNEEQVRATRMAYEGVRQEQQVGLRTTLNVLDAQQDLRSAESALVGARRDEYVAAATVLQAMGALNIASLAPAVEKYDAKTNYDRINHAPGWVPWEPAVQLLDKVGAPSTKSNVK